jgi:UDP:flavonoid glycosyltransferase YjiC (YdhE family)
MRVALVASAHGFGHLTRQAALAACLRDRGVDVSLFSAAPEAFTPPGVRHVSWRVDVGLVQRDSLTEDLAATLPRLAETHTEAHIDALAAALAGQDRVGVDIAPLALEAARRARVPAVAIGNFDWAWIYGHYPELAAWTARFAAWQAQAPAVALWPGPGLHGFRSVHPVGVLGRRLPAVRVAERAVVVSFGGFGLEGLGALLPELPGVTWVFAAPMRAPDRPDCVQVDEVPFPSLVAGADLVLTKPGYGIYAEAALAGTPVVWLDRSGFPEAPSLEAALWARGDVKVLDRSPSGLAAAVRERLAGGRPEPVPGAHSTVADALASG